MPYCPDCGEKVNESQSFCGGCGKEVSELFNDASKNNKSIKRSGSEINHLDCDPQGKWVNAERLDKISQLLDNDEKVHYMWRGGTIDVEGSSAGDSIFGNNRDRKSSIKGIFTAITSKRIVIAIPQVLGDDERHVPYHSATSVDLDTGLVNRRVSIQTKGQTYHIQAQGPSKDELRDAMRFIREKIEDANRPQQIQTESNPDPTEQIKNLKELNEEGILTDEEYESKKQSLLDRI
jgi:hypothetical protein